MKVADFDFDLPPERIAQRPLARRDASRLLVLDRDDGTIEHDRFDGLPRRLRRGDLLVLNDTRVLPVRLAACKPSGGRVEITLVEPEGGARWRALVQASRPPRPGTRLEVGPALAVVVVRREGEGYLLDLETSDGDVLAAIEREGAMPLPPYIERTSPEDRERYQTVFARRPGAIAAPTAGLHVTPELIARLEAAGIERAFVTLHVGPGTFRPVRVERAEDHRLEAERFELPEATAGAVERARARGGRVVAVGTTVVRTLEQQADGAGGVRPGEGRTALFILPGHRFRAVDALVTNFHLPRSTLLMLVSAFAGRERVLAAYREAIERGYRFYSYGDAMLIGSRR